MTAVDRNGTVFVLKKPNHRIRRIGGNNTITTVAGTGERGTTEESYVPGYATQTFAYDDLGWLDYTATQGLGEPYVTDYAYNAEGHLESVVNPADEMPSFLYDLGGRVTQITRPDDEGYGTTILEHGSRLAEATSSWRVGCSSKNPSV